MRASLLLLLLLTAVAHGDAPKPPCKDCTLVTPKASPSGGLPLLVVLHGDRETAATAGARWRDAVRAGWAVLSLQCPRDQGCKDSWWQWGGDIQWLRDQITTTSKRITVDPNRVVGVGWSGGATYLGMHAHEWSAMFAAVVIHGGGMAPSETTCGEPAVPVYFLVGNKNPLHHLAVGLRDFMEGCNSQVKWDVIRGGGHAAERKALTPKKLATIVSWLVDHTASTPRPAQTGSVP